MKLSIAVAALALLAAAPIAAQVGFSPDVTRDLGSGPSLVVADHQVAQQMASGAVIGYLIPPGTLPANVEVGGYHPLPGGTVLLSVDTTTALPGLPVAAPAEPRDVVEFTPATGLFAVFFDGATACAPAPCIPAGVRIDALSFTPAAGLLLSFDTSVTLPVVGAVDDEDVVGYLAGAFAIVFAPTPADVPAAQDLDAFSTPPVGFPPGWLLSVDTSGVVGGVTVADEDVLFYNTGLATYAMYVDASLADAVDWPPTDLVALPEPGALPALTAGAALLAILTTAPGSPSRRSARSSASPPCAESCTG